MTVKAETKFYSLKEVSEMLGLSSKTANNWLKLGMFLGVHRLDGTRWVFEHDFKVKEGAIQGRKVELLRRLVKPNGEPVAQTPQM